MLTININMNIIYRSRQMNLNIVIIIANIIMMFLTVTKIEYEIKEATKTTVEQIERKLNNTNNTMIELKLSDIEKNLLTEIACLGTKNNKDIKEIKDKIVTGKKKEKISQLIDENNNLKEEIEVLKKRNKNYEDEIIRIYNSNPVLTYYHNTI